MTDIEVILRDAACLQGYYRGLRDALTAIEALPKACTRIDAQRVVQKLYLKE